jgi:mono/diheme cytochrome c family protein
MEKSVLRLSAALGAIVYVGLTQASQALEPDWNRGAPADPRGRANPYALDQAEFVRVREQGRLHALVYPFEATGALMPWRPIARLIDGTDSNPWVDFVRAITQGAFSFKSTDVMFEWVGLKHYPEVSDKGVYAVPYPGGSRPTFRMGATFRRAAGAESFTVSCAGCHAGELFGKKVLGLTNRFPHANEFFVRGQNLASQISASMFQLATTASDSETKMFQRFKTNIAAVGAKAPLTDGLDTSLAQVALSLAKRSADETASKSRRFEQTPRPERLTREPADSKPAVWWTAKYKNRWLSDGSVVSGNPVFTNFLWNEIGRGADLLELERWLDANPLVVRELSTAVMSAEAPRITDFFPASRIDLERAKNGQAHFQNACARCHGTYSKGWDSFGSEQLSLADQLATTEVRYFEQTPVVNVGTDPKRREGMSSLASGLNPLRISRKAGTLIEVQSGYVPPPLEGIWARWPYFHNNSAPSLCAVLTRSGDRPKVYYAGDAVDPDRDFDWECVGYPTGAAVPSKWKELESRRYDTTRAGMSNAGHDEGIFLDGGRERFTPEQKLEVIEFLKTL